MTRQISKIVLLLFAFSAEHTVSAIAQQATDSLSFQQVMAQVIQNHPSVKEAQEVLHAAAAKTALAQSGYLPTIDFDASYTRLGPVSKVTFPELGTFQFNPNNNYNAAVSINQTLYDFGKTAKNVHVEDKKKELDALALEKTKQALSSAVVDNYYTLVYLQNAINIKNEELNNLQNHLATIKTKNLTGSATKYQILTTQVKISTIESQKYDLNGAIRIQLSILNTLLGLPEETPHNLANELSPTVLSAEESSVDYAIEHREEMKQAKENTELEHLNYSAIKSANNPVINAFASAGFKNGYSPDQNELKGNFVVGLGIKIPLFDAKKTKNKLLISKSNLITSQFETEIIRRKIVNEVVEAQSGITTAKKKVAQFKLQLDHAQEAFQLAEVSFKSGTITNLDLLDSETAVSESQLQLLKSRLDEMVCMLKLKIAAGDTIY